MSLESRVDSQVNAYAVHLINSPAQTELCPPDQELLRLYHGLERTVSARIKAGQLAPENSEETLIDLWLQAWDHRFQLGDGKVKQLRLFMEKIPLVRLLCPEIQGLRPYEHTGSGLNGQYVPSILTTLQQLVRNGRLSIDVLYSLNSLTQAQRHDHFYSPYTSLIQGALFEISAPEQIIQFHRDYASATLAQILLALKEPAQYLDFVEGIANTATFNDPQFNPEGCSLSSRLIQPALMEYGNEAVDLLNALLWGAGGYQHIGIDRGDLLLNPADLLHQIELHLCNGEPVPLWIDWGWRAQPEQIMVTRMDRYLNAAYFLNLHGERLYMPLDDFETLITHPGPGRSPGMATVLLQEPTEVLEGDISQDALIRLPGIGSNPEHYRLFRPSRYFCSGGLGNDEMSCLLQMQGLNDPQWDSARQHFERLNLAPQEVGQRMFSILQTQEATRAVMRRLAEFREKDRLSNFLRLIDETSRAIRARVLAPEIGYHVLMDTPERYLSTEEIDLLVGALQAQQPRIIQQLLTTVDENKDHLISHCSNLGIAYRRVEHWLDHGLTFAELSSIFQALNASSEIHQVVIGLLSTISDPRELRSLIRRTEQINHMYLQGEINEDEALTSLLMFQGMIVATPVSLAGVDLRQVS
jgi:hypothetical protein